MLLPRIRPYIFVFCVLGCMPSTANAQNLFGAVCEQVTSKAENQFFNAAFEDAIETLQACLEAAENGDAELVGAERAEIYLLLARVYFANQQEAEAADALTALYQLKPDFEVAPPLPPPFIAFATDIQEINSEEEVLDLQLIPPPPIAEERKINNRRWLLIGGSGLFAVTAVAIMSSGRSSTDNVFPPAPGPPGQ